MITSGQTTSTRKYWKLSEFPVDQVELDTALLRARESWRADSLKMNVPKGAVTVTVSDNSIIISYVLEET